MMETERHNLCNLCVLSVFIIHITMTYAVFRCEKMKNENNRRNNNFLHSGPYAHISFCRCRLSSLLSIEFLIHIRTKGNKKLLALVVFVNCYVDRLLHSRASLSHPSSSSLQMGAWAAATLRFLQHWLQDLKACQGLNTYSLLQWML